MFTLKSEIQNKQEIIFDAYQLFRQSFLFSLPYTLLGAFLITTSHFLGNIPFLHFATQVHPLTYLFIKVFCFLIALFILTAYIFRLYCFCNQIQHQFIHSIKQAFYKFIPLLMLLLIYSLLVLSGTMLFILPGIILTFSLMFSFILLIITNENILQTLLTSHRLVWNHWWHTVLIFLFSFFLHFVIQLFCFLVMMSFLTSKNFDFFFLYHCAFLSSIILQACFIHFIFSVMFVLLHDLQERTEKIPSWLNQARYR